MQDPYRNSLPIISIKPVFCINCVYYYKGQKEVLENSKMNWISLKLVTMCKAEHEEYIVYDKPDPITGILQEPTLKVWKNPTDINKNLDCKNYREKTIWEKIKIYLFGNIWM